MNPERMFAATGGLRRPEPLETAPSPALRNAAIMSGEEQAYALERSGAPMSTGDRLRLAVAAPAVAAPAVATAPTAIWFDSGSARLRPYDRAKLDNAALEARSLGAESFCIVASADRVGSSSYNLRLRTGAASS